MLDVAVGIVIFLFFILGLREGIVKSLCSVAAVFVALICASAVTAFLAKAEPRFNDPHFLGAVIIFLLVWVLAYIVLDILLTLLFKRLINIVVLGPVDKVGGSLIGGIKGIIIAGIILQLSLALPLSPAVKKDVTGGVLSRLVIATYHWAYPYAKKWMPLVKGFLHDNLLEKISQQQNLKDKTRDASAKDLLGKVSEYEKIKDDQEKKIHKLLKEQKLLRDAPLKRIEDIK